MWDLIVSVPDHCLSFYFSFIKRQSTSKTTVYIYCMKSGPLARSDACPPGNQIFTGSIPGPAHSFVEIWS